MRRLLVLALIASAFAIAGPAHATCGAAGASTIFRAQFGNHKLTIRTIGSGASLGQPPTTAAGACDDTSTSTPREALFTLVDTSTNQTLCQRWMTDHSDYDPFGFAGGPHVPTTETCGADGSWNALSYALSVAGGADPTRVRFPDAETDAFGASSGLASGAVVTATYWYEATNPVTGLPERITLSGTDPRGSFARGVGFRNS